MKKSILLKIKVVLYLLVPVVLLMLPPDIFDQGESICLSQVLADTECPGCGLTRGIMHLIHFDFQAAYDFNKLSFIVLPLLGVLWFLDLKRDISRIKKTGFQQAASQESD